jgi:hypothetical protein
MEILPCPYRENISSLWKGRELVLHGEHYAPGSGKEARRWRKTKKGTKGAAVGSNLAVSVAQYATHSPGLAVALAGGAAGASATGIGLLVGGGLLMLTSNAFSFHSFLKTAEHKNGLLTIQERKSSYPCTRLPSPGARDVPAASQRDHRQHTMIMDKVLPYIIQKKDAKIDHKFVGAIPVLGVAESIRAVAKKGLKFATGTLGVNRHEAALWLAVHLITHDCALAQAIVANLYSFEEMLWLLQCDSKELVDLLEQKMKST